MRIGFIGTGVMGHGMAANLLRAGFEVGVIVHRNRAPVDDLRAQGAWEATSLNALARGSDGIVLCVTGSPAVEGVIAKLAPHLRSGMLVIDTTTNRTGAPETFAAALERYRVSYVEAPLTGGAQQAREGVLGAIVGCEPDLLDRVRHILSPFCRRVEHFGPVGTAARAKLLSNYLALGTAALAVETFREADALGIDRRKLYELALLGSGNSTALRRIVGSAIKGDFNGYAFSVSNAAKDLAYILDLARETDASLQRAPALEDLFARAVRAGHGERMISELLKADIGDPQA